ncbi:sigma-70 family RNA polymerase sigma factor [Streptomyces sp. NPDC127033]|uniref:sigma-70 family RNA polymerase sigma factor n=1 Tax=Streptomyces sp. NPDC127033 TaxID=3347110 RepID=UPI0036465376
MTPARATRPLRAPRPPQPEAHRPPEPGRAPVPPAAPRDPAPAPGILVRALLPLVRAEAAAEAPAAGVEAGDLEQGAWVRLLERPARAGAPGDPARWVRDVVRAEARRARRTAARERTYRHEPPADLESDPERIVLRTDRNRAVRAAVGRTPGRCPSVLTAMLSAKDLTYREMAGELGMSQGSLGPLRSRCLGCLRRMLAAEVAAPERGGKER